MSDALVLRDDAGGVCTLTLNRPAKRNAINRELFREFRAYIRDIETNGSAVMPDWSSSPARAGISVPGTI